MSLALRIQKRRSMVAGRVKLFWGQFYDKLDKNIEDAPSGCWLWTGKTNFGGYGVLYDPRIERNELVTRLVLEEERGRSLGKLLACHKCDIKRCVNPNHLYAGTSVDNAQDCILRHPRPPQVYNLRHNYS